jgi:hypothetical protein
MQRTRILTGSTRIAIGSTRSAIWLACV